MFHFAGGGEVDQMRVATSRQGLVLLILAAAACNSGDAPRAGVVIPDSSGAAEVAWEDIAAEVGAPQDVVDAGVSRDEDRGRDPDCDPDGCVQLLCVPGALACHQDMVLTLCNNDGSGIAWEKTCDDFNPCTEGDGCADGECLETVPMDCDDFNPCTDDDCGGPTGGCFHTFNSEPCDDGFECTVDDTCVDGECKGGDKVCDCADDGDCAAYEDGDLCNGTLHCDGDGTCSLDEDTVVTCPATGEVCKEFLCQQDTGICYLADLAQGVPCEDDDPCTLDEWCEAGVCIGLPLSCDDGNPCTDELCVPGEGCLTAFNDDPCSDGDPCTWPDACIEGICFGPDFACDDGNPCTEDSCDEESGCVNEPFEGPCDDGDECTSGEVCEGGVCEGEDVSCEDGNFCTWDICDPDQGCTFPFNDLPCDDGNPCTEDDHCYQGACIPGQTLVDCDDSNPCTTDTCDGDTGECFHEPNAFTCEDGDPCTIGDQCVYGACQPGAAKDCDDGNQCTDDACLPSSGACEHLPNLAACDDGNLCTTGDHCQAGVCIPTGGVDCFDGNPCTADACLPSVGCKHSDLDGIACDDYDVCTQGDQCLGGGCLSGQAVECDDGNDCTGDTCHPVFGCQYQDLITTCDDGDPCTTTDQCQGGLCVGGEPKDCDDGDPCTLNWCEAGVGCEDGYDDGAACDDGDPCSFQDLCQGGQCVSQTGHVDCDDGNPCTQDECGPDKCVYYVASGVCDDGDPCTVDDQCVGGTCAGEAVPNCGCRSLLFDGDEDCVVVPAEGAFSTGAFTLEAWIKLQPDDEGVVFALDRGPGVSGRVWRGWVASSGAFMFETYGQGGAQLSATLDAGGGWQHVAVVHTGAALQLWVDGDMAAVAGDVPAPAAEDDPPLTIGCAWDPEFGTWSGHIEGRLDEVRLSDEVVYAAPFDPPPALESDDDTVALWAFDQTQGNAAFDVGGWVHHGVVHGDPVWSADTPAGGICAPLPNLPPSTPEIMVVPFSPVDDDPLECLVVVDSVDPDYDPVEYAYAWYKDGVIQPQISGPQVPATATGGCPAWNCAGCETWTCTVTPSDPSHPGAPVSDEVTVGLAGCESCDGTVFGGSCYKHFSGQNSWSGAQMSCENWQMDGHLVAITGSVENDFVKTLAETISWIGATDEPGEGDWTWVTGEAWDWTGWLPLEPNNLGNEDCAAIYDNGGWNDMDCLNAGLVNVLGYICEDEWDQ